MNFCSNCGKKVDGSNFCSSCGMKINDVDAQLSQAVSPKPVQASTYYPSQSNSQVFLSNLFVEKDEQHISNFGNEQYIQFLNKGKAKKAFVILSNKRLYIRGKRYEINGKGASSPDERGKEIRTEKVVDMKDVKTIEMGRVGRVNSFLYLYSSIITTVLAIVASVITLLMKADVDSEPDITTALSVFIVVTLGLSAVAMLLWMSYVSSIKSCISLLCNGTWIRFPLDKYVGREGYALMRHIIIMQMPYQEVSKPNSNYNDFISAKGGQLIVSSKKIKPKERTTEKTVNLNEITDMVVLRRRLKVTCNDTWFTFPIKTRQEGADIIRYIVEQQAHMEQKCSVKHTND